MNRIGFPILRTFTYNFNFFFPGILSMNRNRFNLDWKAVVRPSYPFSTRAGTIGYASVQQRTPDVTISHSCRYCNLCIPPVVEATIDSAREYNAAELYPQSFTLSSHFSQPGVELSHKIGIVSKRRSRNLMMKRFQPVIESCASLRILRRI